MFDRLTWRCDICKEERPDDLIGVITVPLVIEGRVVGERNIKYCKDKAECIETTLILFFFEFFPG